VNNNSNNNNNNNNNNKVKTLNLNIANVEYKNKSDTSKNRGNWNHLQIIQKAFEQHNWKGRHQGTTGNSHTRHRAHASESTDVKA
jgi:hypothetical protein